MLRKQANPALVGVALLLVLAVIQYSYWRALVYRPEEKAPGRAGGGGGAFGPPVAVGREDVEVDTFAGEVPGYEDGPGWRARFCGPSALALAPDGSLVVADSRNHRIRRISRTARVTTEAGGGQPDGPGGAGEGPASEARFRYPCGVAVAKDGTIYVSDSGNHRICRLRDGAVTTLAGGAEGMADGPGTAARFRWPASLTWGPDDALWVADAGNHAVRRVDLAGQVTTPPAPPEVAGVLGEPGSPSHSVLQASGDGTGPPQSTSFRVGRRGPGALGPGGMVLFADTENHVLVAAFPGDLPLLVAGVRDAKGPLVGFADAHGVRASFAVPCAVALAADGNAYVADYENNRIRRVQLPEWLAHGREPPARSRGFFGRRNRGG